MKTAPKEIPTAKKCEDRHARRRQGAGAHLHPRQVAVEYFADVYHQDGRDAIGQRGDAEGRYRQRVLHQPRRDCDRDDAPAMHGESRVHDESRQQLDA